MDTLKFHLGPLYSTLPRPAGGPPLKRPHGLASPQGEQPVAIYYPFVHPMPYAVHGNEVQVKHSTPTLHSAQTTMSIVGSRLLQFEKMLLWQLRGRMVRGGHGLPEVSLRPAMADPAGGQLLKWPHQHLTLYTHEVIPSPTGW
jgi:hypothetical protein